MTQPTQADLETATDGGLGFTFQKRVAQPEPPPAPPSILATFSALLRVQHMGRVHWFDIAAFPQQMKSMFACRSGMLK